MVQFLLRGLLEVLPQRLAAAEQGLGFVQGLGADLADMVDAHQRSGQLPVRGWEFGRGQGGRGRWPRGTGRDEHRAQARIQRDDQSVTQIDVAALGIACVGLHSVNQCFDEENMKLS
jgi:hypothetical protein